MNYARWSSLLCVSAVVAVLAASCTSTHDTADVVPSPPGAFQPDGGGSLIDEDTACAALTAAESSARKTLGCAAAKRTCPNYVRPAGNDGCFLYDQASVDGCKDLYDSFTACDQFDQRPCLLTAEASCDAGSMVPTGSAGAGGQPGIGVGGGGAGAVGGEPGAGGVAGTAG